MAMAMRIYECRLHDTNCVKSRNRFQPPLSPANGTTRLGSALSRAEEKIWWTVGFRAPSFHFLEGRPRFVELAELSPARPPLTRRPGGRVMADRCARTALHYTEPFASAFRSETDAAPSPH